MEGVMDFPHGAVYQIICKAGEYALKINCGDPNEADGSRITGVQPNQGDVCQLWMIEKCSLKEDSFEIVNCISDMVFDE